MSSTCSLSSEQRFANQLEINQSYRTIFVQPINPSQLPSCVAIKQYFYQEHRCIKLFQETIYPHGLFYGDFLVNQNDESLIKTGDSLQLEGIPNITSYPVALRSFLANTYGKVTVSERQYKLIICHREAGGGFYERTIGGVVFVIGFGIGLFAPLPFFVSSLVSGTIIGAGSSMHSKGKEREEDNFDADFANAALKGACGGAVEGAVGGGVGGSIVKTLGATATITKQAIHAAVNAIGGLFKNVAEARVAEQFEGERGKEKAKEMLSVRNLVASAAGGAAGGVAGAHVGKQVAKIPHEAVKQFVKYGAGKLAGKVAGGKAGKASAVVVNAINGDEITKGIETAEKFGAATGWITGSAANYKVEDKYAKILSLKNKQVTAFSNSGKISLTADQVTKIKDFLEKELYLFKVNGDTTQINKIEGLLRMVNQNKLDRNALHTLFNLGGSSELDNAALAQIIQDEINHL